MTGDIRFSRSSDGGRSFSTPVTVNDNREIISHRFDAMTVNAKGQVFIAWLDKRDLSEARKAGKEYAGAALYYAMSDDGGQALPPQRQGRGPHLRMLPHRDGAGYRRRAGGRVAPCL